MMLFDPHIHMTSRTTDDYAAMADAGIGAIVEPAFWVGQPRTHVGTFEDYFLSLLGWERFRASQFGVRHFCTLALNPKEANNPKVAQELSICCDTISIKMGLSQSAKSG
jgi:predicted metal-dependent TIM-barrel fold hydrolase